MVLFTRGNNTNNADDAISVSLKSLIDDRYSDSHKALRTLAQATLGSYYEDLKRFYQEIFMSDEYQYVLFVARRSIGLAELFFIILWHDNEDPEFRKRLENCWRTATTDSAIMSYVNEIAQMLKLGYCPKIMIVDDLLVQGNGINELLSNLEKAVVSRLQSQDAGIDPDKYWKNIVNSICIRVFAQNNKVSVVKLQYQLQLKPLYHMPPKQWHDLSRRIAGLMMFSGTANASFIMGVELPGDVVQRRLLDNPIRFEDSTIAANCEMRDTFYERYYFGWSDPRQPLPKYHCTVRAIKNQFTGRYLVLPFVFLPNLTDQAYDYLKSEILKKWGVSSEVCALFPDNQDTSRLEYEAMMLHLSESLLMCWMKAAGIDLDQDDFVPTKIALNYGINRSSPLISSDLFYRLTNPAYLFAWDELQQLLFRVTSESAPLAAASTAPVPEKQIRKQIEDDIYLIKVQELFEACRSSQVLSSEHKPILDHTFKDSNWNIGLEKFTSDFCTRMRGISVGYLFRCLLSFMDQGIITLKAREEDSRFAQVLRMGEQSLFIWPQRYAPYYPILSYLEMRKERFKADFQHELSAFLNHQQALGKLESDTDANALTAELTKYLDTLRNSGQEPEDWDIGFEKSLLLDMNSIQADTYLRQLYLQERLNYMHAKRVRRTLLNDCETFFSY